jgi:tetratricopeptide (TPR) repeat protein
MRGIAVVLALAFMAPAAPARAAADPASTAGAVRAAAAGDYRQAVRGYEQALHQNGYSAPVLFNLGNSWLRLGRPARAILEYERALVLAPGNAAIAANLATARQRAGLAVPAAGPWLTAARYFSFDTYVWAALVAVWVLCAALILLCLHGAARRLARPLVLICVAVLCASADAAVLCWPDLSRAVVQAPAPLQLAPARSATSSATLREGEVVWIQGHYAGFDLVSTSDGRSGWITRDAVLTVRAGPP